MSRFPEWMEAGPLADVCREEPILRAILEEAASTGEPERVIRDALVVALAGELDRMRSELRRVVEAAPPTVVVAGEAAAVIRASARREALEEAAQVCASVRRSWTYGSADAEECEEAIRRLARETS